MLSFSFSSTRGPEISPQNTGDKRQMNHDAEYDNVGISDACFVKGLVYEEVRLQRSIRAYLGHPGTRYSDAWCLPEPSDGEGRTRGPVLGSDIFR